MFTQYFLTDTTIITVRFMIKLGEREKCDINQSKSKLNETEDENHCCGDVETEKSWTKQKLGSKDIEV